MFSKMVQVNVRASLHKKMKFSMQDFFSKSDQILNDKLLFLRNSIYSFENIAQSHFHAIVFVCK